MLQNPFFWKYVFMTFSENPETWFLEGNRDGVPVPSETQNLGSGKGDSLPLPFPHYLMGSSYVQGQGLYGGEDYSQWSPSKLSLGWDGQQFSFQFTAFLQ